MIRTRLQGDVPFFANMLNNGKVEVCLKEDVDKEIARHKYRRCLTMAKLCHWKIGVFIYKKEKNDFYYRWRKRWLELAEKFKEAK